MSLVVLHHGLFGFGAVDLGPISLRYFSSSIERTLRVSGCRVLLSRVHPTGGVELRARQLKAFILRHTRSNRRPQKIVILAHSMGGLDARYMISNLGMAGRVSALVTVCTPHRGSPYADWVLHHLGERLGAGRLVEAIGLNLSALPDLTTKAAVEFNRVTPDAPGVAYLSISAASRASTMIRTIYAHSHAIIRRVEGENDGLVSVRSAAWGEHLATWEADHLQAIDRRILPVSDEVSQRVNRGYEELIRGLVLRGLIQRSSGD